MSDAPSAEATFKHSPVTEFEEEKKKIEELRKERDVLQAEVTDLTKIRDDGLAVNKALKEKKKKTKNKYENNVWIRVDTERELQKLAENLKIIDSKIEEARLASATTDTLYEKLNVLKTHLQHVVTSRNQLQLERSALEAKILETRSKLAEQSTRASCVFHSKRDETNLLFEKFHSRRSISEVILKLYGDIEHIKKKTQASSTRRSNLCYLAHVQFQQIRHRIQIASAERVAIEKNLDDGISQHSTLCNGLEDVANRISGLLQDLENGTQIPAVTGPANEIVDKIDTHLHAIDSLDIREGEQADTELSHTLSSLEERITQESTALNNLDTNQERLNDRLLVIDSKISNLKQTRLLTSRNRSSDPASPSKPY